jgi:hypothetical protein
MMNDKNTMIHSTLEEGYDFFITDKWSVRHHYKISTFEVPSGFLSEAYEVIENDIDNEPRVFHILSGFDCDIEEAELKLKEKVKTGVNRRYLDCNEGKLSIGDDLQVAGRIQWSDKLIDSNFDYFFEIDGKKITIEKFIAMLEEVEGWNFKFQIIDTTDPID